MSVAYEWPDDDAEREHKRRRVMYGGYLELARRIAMAAEERLEKAIDRAARQRDVLERAYHDARAAQDLLASAARLYAKVLR